MVMRWKKDPAATGLARVRAGPRGSTLRIDADVRVATVQAVTKERELGWFWVAGWGHPDVPHHNSCNTPVASEKEAKDKAMEYVKKWLALAAKKTS